MGYIVDPFWLHFCKVSVQAERSSDLYDYINRNDLPGFSYFIPALGSQSVSQSVDSMQEVLREFIPKSFFFFFCPTNQDRGSFQAYYWPSPFRSTSAGLSENILKQGDTR